MLTLTDLNDTVVCTVDHTDVLALLWDVLGDGHASVATIPRTPPERHRSTPLHRLLSFNTATAAILDPLEG